MIRIRNVTRETILCTEAVIARSFLARLRGLMFRRTLSPGSGLLLVPEHSIHTFGMRFAIDVLYLDDAYRVLRLQEAMPPNRIGPIVRGCRAILEIPPGTIRQSRTQIGDLLAVEDPVGHRPLSRFDPERRPQHQPGQTHLDRVGEMGVSLVYLGGHYMPH